jgi:hypothetical protein
MVSLIDHGEIFIEAPVAQEIHSMGMTVLKSYKQLHDAASAEFLYKLRPKLHAMWHFVQLYMPCQGAVFVENVGRSGATWMEEDFMGRVAKLAGKTHRSSFALRTLQRYLLLLSLNLHAAPAGSSASRFRRKFAVKHRTRQGKPLRGEGG